MSAPQLYMTTPEERQALLNQSLKILEEVGHEIQSPEAIEYLVAAGGIADGTRVRLPREVVLKAAETAPTFIKIYTRDGREAMNLGGRNTYYGSGPTCPFYFDAHTGERHKATKEDAAITARVADALDNIDFVMSLVMIEDQVKVCADIHEIDAMVRNTTKPICSWTFNKENLQVIIDMCATVAGGLEALQEKPFVIIYAEPTSPMIHTREALEKVILLAQNKVPCIYTPGLILSATGPVTIAGTVSVGVSETLVGLVLSQAVNPGAPFIAGVGGGPMDMQTMQHSYGAPEWPFMYGIASELMRDIGIPSFSGAGATDSKCVDGQATAEAMIQIFCAEGTGGNLVHDVGFMDLGMTGSPLFMTLNNDIIGYVRRMYKGADIDEDALGYETIAEVGPGGNFLTEDHTLDNFNDAIWRPQLFDRREYGDWKSSGASTMTERAQARLDFILADHACESLPADVAAKLDAYVAAADAQH